MYVNPNDFRVTVALLLVKFLHELIASEKTEGKKLSASHSILE